MSVWLAVEDIESIDGEFAVVRVYLFVWLSWWADGVADGVTVSVGVGVIVGGGVMVCETLHVCVVDILLVLSVENVGTPDREYDPRCIVRDLVLVMVS